MTSEELKNRTKQMARESFVLLHQSHTPEKRALLAGSYSGLAYRWALTIVLHVERVQRPTL